MKRVAATVFLFLSVLAFCCASFTLSGDFKVEYLYTSYEETEEVEYNFSSDLSLKLKPQKHVTIVIPLSAENDRVYEVGKIKGTFKLGKVKFTMTMDPEKVQLTESKLTGSFWSVDLLKGYMNGEYAISPMDYEYNEIKEDFNLVLFNNTTGSKKKKDGMTFKIKDFTIGLSKDDLSFQTPLVKFGDLILQTALITQAMNGGKYFSFSASVDYTPQDFEFFAAFDSRMQKTFNYDALARISFEPVEFDFYYVNKTSRPSGRYAMNKYFSFLSKFSHEGLTAHFGIKDMLVTNAMQTLFMGAGYENKKIDFEATVLYNLDDKVFVTGCSIVFLEVVPDLSFRVAGNFWKQKDNTVLTGRTGVVYLGEKCEFSADISSLVRGDKPLALGFNSSVTFNSLIQGVELEASVNIDPYKASTISGIAEMGRKYYSDNMPDSLFDGGRTVSISCTCKL